MSLYDIWAATTCFDTWTPFMKYVAVIIGCEILTTIILSFVSRTKDKLAQRKVIFAIVVCSLLWVPLSAIMYKTMMPQEVFGSMYNIYIVTYLVFIAGCCFTFYRKTRKKQADQDPMGQE